MAEMVFDTIQFGRQSVVGTAVAATTVYPGKFETPALDRGYLNPDEDFGSMSDEQAGRGAMGVRGASGTLTAQVRFEDIMHLFEMHLAGSIVPTGANPYTWTYTADDTSDTTKFYTMELGSENASDQWRLTGCCIDTLTLGFDQLASPGNSPWTADASVQALDRSITAKTGALAAPAILETVEGHLTTISEGSVATAFASLTALTASLVSFKLTSNRPYARRAYGGATDIATLYGMSEKAGATFDAEIAIGATAKTNIHDNFNAAGSPITEKRWRIRSTGSGAKTLTADMRVRYRVVDRGNRDGEAVYAVTGSVVKDATLGGRLQIVSAGTAVSTLP